MKTACGTLGRTALMLGFATLVACGGGGPSYDEDSPEGQAYEFRHAVMHVAGVKMEFINNMAREQIPVDEAAFLKAVQELAVLTEMMPEGFEQNLTVAESRTEPSVWDNKADFDSRMRAAIDATARLAQTAETSGFEAARSLVVTNPTTSSNCSGCHNSYRASEEE